MCIATLSNCQWSCQSMNTILHKISIGVLFNIVNRTLTGPGLSSYEKCGNDEQLEKSILLQDVSGAMATDHGS